MRFFRKRARAEDFGCDYCADAQNRFYGHVTQIGSNEELGLVLLRCPRCDSLYETAPRGADETRRLSAAEAEARFPGALEVAAVQDPTMRHADLVWNRAAMDGGGSSPRTGDSALVALLLVHGMVCNGGVIHSIEVCSADELRAGCAGYRSFGLEDAAELIEEAASKVTRDEARAGDYDEELEFELDQRYGAVIPTDETIVQRFEAHLSSHPEDFDPV